MSAAQIAFTGAAVLFVLLVAAVIGLHRAVTANDTLVARLDVTQAALNTALRITGRTTADIPRQPGKDDYR